VSDAASSKRPASIFLPGESRTLTLAATQITAQFPDTGFMWEKKPSLAQYDQLALPWPSTVYTPRLENQKNMNQAGYLVGRDDAPSFPTLGAAFNAFLHDDFAISGTGNPSLGEVSVRIVDQRARIRRVRIRPVALDVWLGGRALAGCRLELNGIEDRQVAPVLKPGRISFPLPGGLPSDAWLWLKCETEWLDFRALNNWGGHRSPDIEVQLPDDPGADISRLATQGEGLHLEYKSKLPDTRDEKRHVLKTAVAFANGEGGTVLFGVSDDNEVTGLAGSLQEARARLTDLIRDLINPAPEARIETRRHDGRNVLLLHISPNSGVLHALTINPNRPEYYVRRDGTTFYARPDEVAAIVRQGSQQLSQKTWLGPW
jgi:Schlafen, AlbA_2